MLEAEGFDCWLVNAREVKNVPGRAKTDRADAVWLAKVAERGMCRPSLVHPPPIRRLRDLTRYRRALGQNPDGFDNRDASLGERMSPCPIPQVFVFDDLRCDSGKEGKPLRNLAARSHFYPVGHTLGTDFAALPGKHGLSCDDSCGPGWDRTSDVCRQNICL